MAQLLILGVGRWTLSWWREGMLGWNACLGFKGRRKKFSTLGVSVECRFVQRKEMFEVVFPAACAARACPGCKVEASCRNHAHRCGEAASPAYFQA